MDPAKKIYFLQCTRCKIGIETYTEPSPRMTIFLCNSCGMKWKEMEDRMIGHAYEDERRKAFINFVNSLPYLKNTTLRGL